MLINRETGEEGVWESSALYWQFFYKSKDVSINKVHLKGEKEAINRKVSKIGKGQ